jgi:predicted Rossmann fold flavoprotein
VDAGARVIVVGGGAAGLVAAIAAARAGARVTVLERMARVGKKLLATGNGRCNLANARLELTRFHGADPAFPAPALAAFGLDATLAFFAGLGVAAREEDGGKLFPRSGQASAVLDLLRHETARLGVETHCETEVAGLAPLPGGWEVATRAGSHRCTALVLAAGGRASPQLGSNGSGYELVRPLGHRLVAPFPALTRIRVASPFLKHLKGVKVDGTATLVPGGPERRAAATHGDPGACASGEILFTETGLSGPPILDLSRRAGERAQRREPTAVLLDLCPEIGEGDLAALLRRRLGGRGDASAELALVGFLHKRLIVPVLRTARVPDPARPAAALGTAEIAALAAALKRWRFEVTGTDSWTDAQVTAGGVDVSGVDPHTLASRLAPGLFFAGEVLDVDGDCGGFNLQWAWSSGHVAGTGAAALARSSPPPSGAKGGRPS